MTFLQSKEPTINNLLVKVASRCNLNCDYCYVFNHNDQSWKDMPPVFSKKNISQLAQRIKDYIELKNLSSFLVVFHGGEPLLYGSEMLVHFAEEIRSTVGGKAKVDFSLQTNGSLLKKYDIENFSKYNIGVSLSLDGPQEVNDLHRLTRKGNSSFSKVLKAYQALQDYPEIFTGVISVIDARVDPGAYLEFFSALQPPNLDFLLPDANYVKPPIFRDNNPEIYKDWLLRCFNLWMDKYPNLKVRMFDGLLASLYGADSGTDFFGLGDVNLLSIETDSTYHDLDVLKITSENTSSLGMSILTHSIHEASLSDKIKQHRKLLSFDGLSDKCKQCSVLQVCGGGAIPHRYSKEGFNNPTIYCEEMKALINHAQNRLDQLLDTPKKDEFVDSPKEEEPLQVDIVSYNYASRDNLDFLKVVNTWIDKTYQNFVRALDYILTLDPSLTEQINKINAYSKQDLKHVARLPSVVFWVSIILKNKKGRKVFDTDKAEIPMDLQYLYTIEDYLNQEKGTLRIHEEDVWLRYPFGTTIEFEENSFKIIGQELIEEALNIIKQYNEYLYEEISLISPVIQLIKHPRDDLEGFVSFSDNVVPGALYICLKNKEKLISPYDLADSIIHEHRHQKLYLLESFTSLVVSDYPYVPSPWRKELRPVSGLYHAVFVFYELRRFWKYVSEFASGELRNSSILEKQKDERQLQQGMSTLEGCKLTPVGEKLLYRFKEQLNEALQCAS